MIYTYLKTGIRHLKKHKAFVVINTLGLGIALSMCIVSYVIWKFSEDFDAFHKNKLSIYRVNTIKAETQQFYGVAPSPLAISVPDDLSGVEDAIGLDSWNAITNVGQNSFWEQIHFTDSRFFKWFDFPVILGEVEINDPSKILLSEKMATKYFGKDNPLGKVVSIYADDDRRRDLTVSGVLKDFPINSSIQIDFVTAFDNQIRSDGTRISEEDWGHWRDAVFLVLAPQTGVQNINRQLDRYVEAHNSANTDFGTLGFSLEPLSLMAQKGNSLRWNALTSSLPPGMIWGNIVMAILLLLTACLNFANMTVSMSGKRLKEIGIRKVMGSSKNQLVQQLFSESFLVCLMALVIGVFLSGIVMDFYNRQWPIIELEFSVIKDPFLLTFLLGTVLLTTLLSGAYPALYISSFSPHSIFQGKVKFGGSNLVSRVLLGAQVSISLIAIVAGLSFARNAQFQENADLGFARSGIQAVYTGDQKTFNIVNNSLQSNPAVKAAAGVRHHIGDSCPRVEFSLKGEKHEVEFMTIGENYMELMELKMVSGRPFDYRLETDYQNTILINEKFANEFFPGENPIGQSAVFFDTVRYSIAGVVNNFMQDNFFDPIRPLALKLAKEDRFLYLAVKSDPQDALVVQDALSAIWKENFPMTPFVHYFQNDFIASSLMVTNNIKLTMGIFAIITILLTVTGLFALMSLNILKKMKEIAVRRVLGASLGQITLLLNKAFIWIVLGGIIIGCAVGGWLSATLLDSIFQVHSGISVWLMSLAGFLAFVVIGLTVSIKIAEVMKTNPADILKAE